MSTPCTVLSLLQSCSSSNSPDNSFSSVSTDLSPLSVNNNNSSLQSTKKNYEGIGIPELESELDQLVLSDKLNTLPANNIYLSSTELCDFIIIHPVTSTHYHTTKKILHSFCKLSNPDASQYVLPENLRCSPSELHAFFQILHSIYDKSNLPHTTVDDNTMIQLLIIGKVLRCEAIQNVIDSKLTIQLETAIASKSVSIHSIQFLIDSLLLGQTFQLQTFTKAVVRVLLSQFPKYAHKDEFKSIAHELNADTLRLFVLTAQ